MVLMVGGDDYEVLVEWQWQEKTKILGENLSLYQHGLELNWVS